MEEKAYFGSQFQGTVFYDMNIVIFMTRKSLQLQLEQLVTSYHQSGDRGGQILVIGQLSPFYVVQHCSLYLGWVFPPQSILSIKITPHLHGQRFISSVILVLSRLQLVTTVAFGEALPQPCMCHLGQVLPRDADLPQREDQHSPSNLAQGCYVSVCRVVMANTVGSQEMTCYFPCVWPHHGIRLSESSVCIPRAQPLLACNALPCLVSESADLSELDSSSVRVLPFHSSPAPAPRLLLRSCTSLTRCWELLFVRGTQTPSASYYFKHIQNSSFL